MSTVDSVGMLNFVSIYVLLFLLFLFFILLDFIYRGSLFNIFTTLIYHKVLINNKTEQDTEQDKQTKILCTTVYLVVSGCIIHVYILDALQQHKNAVERAMHDMYFYEYILTYDKSRSGRNRR